MKWMTTREVERAAKKGPLAALDNSIEKWTQMRDAPAQELKAKLKRTSGFDAGAFCALCVRHPGCVNCTFLTISKVRCYYIGWGAYMAARNKWLWRDGPIAPVRKAIRTLIRNMKKARKLLVEQLKENTGA